MNEIKFRVSDEQKELIEKWQELLRLKSIRETTEFLVTLGTMSLELVGGGPLTADNFASALYTVGSRIFAAEFNANARDTIEEFKRWRENQGITVQTSSNERRLVQR